jgi:hypothetical protein
MESRLAKSRNPESRRCQNSTSRVIKPFSTFWQLGVQERRSREIGSPDSWNHEIMNSKIPKIRCGHG